VARPMPRLLLVMALTLLVAAPAANAAGTRSKIISDCFDNGRLDGDYTASQIRDARNNLPADVDQYSDCRDVLARALGGSGSDQIGGGSGGAGGGAGGGGGSGGGAGAQDLTPNGPDEQQALSSAAAEGGDAPIQVGSGTIVPGASGFAADAARNDLPPTLIVALALLALAALAGAVPSLRRRVFRRRLA
jgi:hypothetical protein